MPSSSMNFRSFLLFFTASQESTLHTRISHLEKSSMLTSGSMGSNCGFAGAFIFSSSASAFSMSRRGKSVSPLCTETFAGRAPNTAALSQLEDFSSAPICAKAFSQLSGMKGLSMIRLMRRHSRRLYRTLARRAFLLSSLASCQGAVSSIYLFARWMSLKTSSSARCS